MPRCGKKDDATPKPAAKQGGCGATPSKKAAASPAKEKKTK
jgi:hypothetical protein